MTKGYCNTLFSEYIAELMSAERGDSSDGIYEDTTCNSSDGIYTRIRYPVEDTVENTSGRQRCWRIA